MDCTHCNVRPAVVGNIPTLFGLADLCNHCLGAVGRKRPKRTERGRRPPKKRKARPPRHLPGQQQFPFMYETETDGPEKTARSY